LPAIDSNEFLEEFSVEYNDALLATYLAVITKGIGSLHELIAHHGLSIAEKKNSNRSTRGFPMMMT